MRLRHLLVLLPLSLLWNCGANSSFNQIYVTKSDRNRLDVLIEMGERLYQRGELRQAEKLFNQAYGLNPQSERVVKNLAYVYLAQAELSLFQIIPKIIKVTKNTTTQSSGNTPDILSYFNSITGLTAGDVEALTPEVSESDNPFLTGTVVYYPATPGSHLDADSPRYKIPVLLFLNRIIQLTCPFTVDLYNETHTNPRYYLITAFAHFFEAVIFNSALVRGDDATGSLAASGLFVRANKISAAKDSVTTAQITDYLAAVEILSGDISRVLDSSEGAMLQQTVLDLKTAVAAFKSIPSLPSSVTDLATGALTKVEDAASSVKNSTSELAGTTENFRNQVNKLVVDKLKPAIQKVIDTKGVSAEQITEACASFKNIAGEGASLPTGC
jgi:hypothetical protein